MAEHLRFSKKGVSEMVGYVLLIVIALGLSVLVYVYLEKFTPKGKLDCPEGVSISLRSVECKVTGQQLRLEFFNNGLFKVDGIYVKMGIAGRSTRTNLNDPEDESKNPFYLPLGPQKVFRQNYSTVNFGTGVVDGNTYILDLQPAIAEKEGLHIAVCEGASISQEIVCKKDCEDGDYLWDRGACSSGGTTQTGTLSSLATCVGPQTITKPC